MQVNGLIEAEHKAWNSFREEHGKVSPDGEVLSRIEADLSRVEDQHSAYMRTLKAKAANDDFCMEEPLRSTREERLAFAAYIRYGMPRRAEKKWAAFSKRHGVPRLAEIKALSAVDGPAGAYLTPPPELLLEIAKAVSAISPIRSIARIRKTANTTAQVPKRTSPVAVVWVSERGFAGETTPNPAYGGPLVETFEAVSKINLSAALLEDLGFDATAELAAEFGEAFALAEGTTFISGDGNGKAWGITNTSQGVATTGTGGATIAASTGAKGDALINLTTSIKEGYLANAHLVLNRTVLGSARKLTDSNGGYLFAPSPAGGMPPTLAGYPYVLCPDMPAEGAGATPIAFGDFSKGYVVVDRIEFALMRDDITFFDSGQVLFRARRRVGGQVLVAEALRLLKCA